MDTTPTKNSVGYGAAGVFLAGGALENCTVTGNSNHSIPSVAGGVAAGASPTVLSTPVMRNTIAYGNTCTNVVVGNGSLAGNCTDFPLAGDGNIVGDPLFSGVANADYRLRATSPCRDSGIYQSWMNLATDLAGKARIHGSQVDIGCYECALPAFTLLLLR